MIGNANTWIITLLNKNHSMNWFSEILILFSCMIIRHIYLPPNDFKQFPNSKTSRQAHNLISSISWPQNTVFYASELVVAFQFLFTNFSFCCNIFFIFTTGQQTTRPKIQHLSNVSCSSCFALVDVTRNTYHSVKFKLHYSEFGSFYLIEYDLIRFLYFISCNPCNIPIFCFDTASGELGPKQLLLQCFFFFFIWTNNQNT